MAHVAGLAVMLTAFWLLLSGHYTPMLLAFGGASVALTAALAWRMDIVDHEGRPLPLGLRAPAYWLWLGGQILLSSWDVTRRIWARRVQLEPVLRTTPAGAMSDLLRVTYANSITLTPGTLSVGLDDRHIEVHALDATLLADLDRGGMARRARWLVPD